MTPSAEPLLSIARQYWPTTLEDYLHPENSPERKRLQAQWRQALTHMEEWRTFLHELGNQLHGFTLGNVTTPFDACLRCGVYPEQDNRPSSPEWVIVGCASILAPVYTVYGVRYERQGLKRINHELFLGSLPPEIQTPAGIIARSIEARFGFSVLPSEIAKTPVPLFVDPRQPPDTTLFHALFTSQPERVP